MKGQNFILANILAIRLKTKPFPFAPCSLFLSSSHMGKVHSYDPRIPLTDTDMNMLKNEYFVHIT